MKVLFLVMFLMLSLIQAKAQKIADPAFDKLIAQTIDGTVPTISCAGLELKLKTEVELVLLDARELAEYKVSHIKGAKHVSYDMAAYRSLKKLPKNTNIIIYCSIGYRSEKVGEKLLKKGFENVQNLYGGIFEWVNRGNEVVDKDEISTENIHIYDAEWAKWVRRGKKVY